MNAQTAATLGGYSKGISAMMQDLAKMPPAQQRALAQQYPAMAAMLKGSTDAEDPGRVHGDDLCEPGHVQERPAGLDHYKPLVDTMRTNVDNYAAIDALPSMEFFPWFFIIPGLIALAAAAYLLVGDIRPTWVWPKLDQPGPKAGEPLAH